MAFALFLSFKAGISFLLCIALALLSREKNRWGNIYLSLCFLSYTLFSLDDALGTVQYFGQYSPYWQLMNIPIFLIPVWMYLAIRHYSQQLGSPTKWTLALLFIPVLFRIGTFLFGQNLAAFHWPMTIVEDALLLTFLILTAYLSTQQLAQHTRRMQVFYSNLSPVNLSWFSHFLLGFTLIRLMSLLISSFRSISQLTVLADLADFSVLLFLAYHSLSQQEIFPNTSKGLLPIKTAPSRSKEGSSSSSIAISAALQRDKQRLLAYMEQQKPYLNPELTLPELAAQLSMKANDLSYFLNGHLGENFYSLINRYRVEESKRLLSDPNYDHFSMLGIAMEAGFNSKTAFNTNFKKSTQLTPSEYRKRH